MVYNVGGLVGYIIPLDYISFFESYRANTTRTIHSFNSISQILMLVYILLYGVFLIIFEIMVTKINMEISKMRWMITFLSPATVKSSIELSSYVISEIKES